MARSGVKTFWNSRLAIALLATGAVILGFQQAVHAQAAASIKEISKRTIAMPKPADCKSLDICELKGITFIERKLKVILPGETAEYATYMTDTQFVVDTDKPESIPKFGVVQFLKGCMFESELQADGSVQYNFMYAHHHMGSFTKLKHQDWVVNSDSVDPVYTSYTGYGRFDIYRWNADPKNYDPENAEWYFYGAPPHGTVFKNELIGTTGLKPDHKPLAAANSSIELETCLFKIGDLPMTTDSAGSNLDHSKAIWCASWDHKFVYDFSKSKVVQEKKISPICSLP